MDGGLDTKVHGMVHRRIVESGLMLHYVCKDLRIWGVCAYLHLSTAHNINLIPST